MPALEIDEPTDERTRPRTASPAPLEPTGTGTGTLSERTGAIPRERTGTFTSREHTLSEGLTPMRLSDPRRGGQVVRGLRLDQAMLLGTLLLVLGVVGVSGALQALNTNAEFNDLARAQRERMESQAREVGKTLSHLVSLSSATSLRDNNYAGLSELVQPIVLDNPSVLRVQIVDNDSNPVADTDKRPNAPKAKFTSVSTQRLATYDGKAVSEYYEPITMQAGAKGNALGTVVLSYSLEQVQADLRRVEEHRVQSVERTTYRTFGLGAVFVVIGAMLAAVQSRRVTRSLGDLTEEAKRLAEGELDARVTPRKGSSREVQTLGLVFNHMADQIRRLVEEARAGAMLEQEMRVAKEVQETLLPGRHHVEVGPLRLAGSVVPASECGGDWWFRERLDDRRVVVGLGDVTGHWLSTALIATTAISALAAAMKLRHPEGINAELLMAALNETLFHVGKGEYVMSSTLCIFDVVAGELEFVNGGHPPPYRFNRRDRSTASLLAKGPLVGNVRGYEFQAKRTKLNPGDVFVFYSDGLVEMQDAEGHEYGRKRLRAALETHAELPAHQLRDAILQDLKKFSGLPPQDDTTVVIAEFGIPSTTQGFA